MEVLLRRPDAPDLGQADTPKYQQQRYCVMLFKGFTEKQNRHDRGKDRHQVDKNPGPTRANQANP